MQRFCILVTVVDVIGCQNRTHPQKYRVDSTGTTNRLLSCSLFVMLQLETLLPFNRLTYFFSYTTVVHEVVRVVCATVVYQRGGCAVSSSSSSFSSAAAAVCAGCCLPPRSQ